MTVDEVEQLMQGAARQGVALTYAQALALSPRSLYCRMRNGR